MNIFDQHFKRLNETPEEIYVDGVMLGWAEAAYTFGAAYNIMFYMPISEDAFDAVHYVLALDAKKSLLPGYKGDIKSVTVNGTPGKPDTHTLNNIGHMKRRGNFDISGRVWLSGGDKGRTISFWDTKKEVMKYWPLVIAFLKDINIDPTSLYYEFINSDIVPYTKLQNTLPNNRSTDEINQLRAKQHEISPLLKKKKEKPPPMKRHSQLNPGQKWWAMNSEEYDINKSFRERLAEATFDDEWKKIKDQKLGQRSYSDPQDNEYDEYDDDNYPVHEPAYDPNERYKTYNNTRWLFPNLVIRSGRPGYPNEDFQDESIVDEWLEMVKRETGTTPKTIITFLDDLELAEFYNFDLIKAYEDRGITVHRVPTEDPVFKPMSERGPIFTFKQFQKIASLIKESEKPVLISCSAGVDRTGSVARYLQKLHDGMTKPKKPYSPHDSSDPDQVDKFRRRYGDRWDK